jgi:hypothetical protein
MPSLSDFNKCLFGVLFGEKSSFILAFDVGYGTHRLEVGVGVASTALVSMKACHLTYFLSPHEGL